jgi:hypothetical protein
MKIRETKITKWLRRISLKMRAKKTQIRMKKKAKTSA